MDRTRLTALPLAMALILGGCAASAGDYPSLSLRPAEKTADDAGAGDIVAPAPAETPDPNDPQLTNQISQLTDQLSRTAKAFDSAQAAASPVIDRAMGRAAGSQAWLDAQIALGTLDQRHAATRDAAAVIENLLIERMVAQQPVPPALEQANAAARKTVEDQQATMDALAAKIIAAPAPSSDSTAPDSPTD